MKNLYFDYAATTPMDPRVKAAMEPYFSEKFGNPGSLHRFGQKASAAVFQARQTISKAIGAHYSEIIFTGSATEANNLALRGTVKRIMNHELGIKNKKIIIHNSKFLIPRVIISAIEHESVLKTARDLERDGVEVITIPVSKEGMVDLKKLKAALNERTVLVSVMYANNEVGTIQPIKEIAKVISEYRIANNESRTKNSKFIIHNSQFYPLFHTDAVQAFQYLDCNVNTLGVDLMTLSGHKIYGPKGIGVLYAKNYELGIRNQAQKTIIRNSKFLIQPLITGGGQEEGLRSGTENVPLIVGMEKAVELAQENREKESKRVSGLQTSLIKQIKKVWPGAQLNGSLRNRLPNNVHIYFPHTSGEELMVALDLKGISVATGPACSARTAEPSHVFLAMGYSKERAMSSLRITMGRLSTSAEIKQLVSALKAIRR